MPSGAVGMGGDMMYARETEGGGSCCKSGVGGDRGGEAMAGCEGLEKAEYAIQEN
jgi:hypothetical protein